MNPHDFDGITISFVQRPSPVPHTWRPMWRVGLLVLVMYLVEKGKGTSFLKLAIINWGLRSPEATLRWLNNSSGPSEAPIRYEPNFMRALDVGVGEGLLTKDKNGKLHLTQAGLELAVTISQSDVYRRERAILEQLGNVSENRVRQAVRGGG